MSEGPTIEQVYQVAIDRLLGRHKWRLLNRDEFAQRTLDHLRAGIAASTLQAAIYTYSRALYNACSGAEGAERQDLGYTELYRYLYESARHRYPDVYEDAAQRALMRTFERFERCRQSGAFLAFALQQLMDAARVARRQSSYEPLRESVPDLRQPDPDARLIAGELRLRFEQLVGEFLRKHPRATQQFAALRMKYLDGLDDVAISLRLGKTVENVYVLRSRAIEKLRGDSAWQALARELGLLDERSQVQDRAGATPFRSRRDDDNVLH